MVVFFSLLLILTVLLHALYTRKLTLLILINKSLPIVVQTLRWPGSFKEILKNLLAFYLCNKYRACVKTSLAALIHRSPFKFKDSYAEKRLICCDLYYFAVLTRLAAFLRIDFHCSGQDTVNCKISVITGRRCLTANMNVLQ